MVVSRYKCTFSEARALSSGQPSAHTHLPCAWEAGTVDCRTSGPLGVARLWASRSSRGNTSVLRARHLPEGPCIWAFTLGQGSGGRDQAGLWGLQRARERVRQTRGRGLDPRTRAWGKPLLRAARRRPAGPGRSFPSPVAVTKATAAEDSRAGLRPPANRTGARPSPDSLCSAAISGPGQEAAPLRQKGPSAGGLWDGVGPGRWT